MKIPIIKQFLYFLYKILDIIFVQIVSGCFLPAQCKIGKNLILPHGGNGIVINAHAVIGNNVTIYHQVTLGVKEHGSDLPKVGDNVIIGAGAKILGGVVIGDGAKIGANAVVLKDVPANATAVGAPAKIIISTVLKK